MSKERIRNSLKNVGAALIFQVLYILASFAVRTFFIRQLGNDYLSLNGLFTNIISLLSFAELGIGTAVTYSLYKPLIHNEKQKIVALMHFFKKAYKYIRIVILILGLSLIPILRYFINDIDPNINYYVIYILFVVNTYLTYVFSYKKTLLIADQKNYIVVTIEKILFLIQSTFQCTVLFLWHNYVAFLLVQIICTILTNCITAKYVNVHYSYITDYGESKLDNKEIGDLFSDIKSVFLYKIGAVILNGTDNLLISKLIATSVVGLYSNYSMVVSAVNSVLMQACNSLAATIGQYSAETEKEKGVPVFNELFLINYWLFGVCSVCLFVLLNPFIVVWIGESYRLSLYVVAIIVLVFYVSGINQIPSLYRTAFGIFRQARFLPLIAAVVNIVLSIVLGKTIGLIGIFLATAIAKELTFNIFDPLLVFSKGFDCKPLVFFARKILYFVLLVLNAAICFFISRVIPDTNMIMLLFKAIIVFIVSNLFYLVCFFETSQFRRVISRFNNSFYRRR